MNRLPLELPRQFSNHSTSVRRLVACSLLLAFVLSGLINAAFADDPLGLPEVTHPQDNAPTPEKIALGKQLFFDTRLSSDGRVSCATCHDPAHAFTDQRALARGVAVARRNAPSVIDAARRRWLGWDGKFDSLWSQALSPLENPVEMGGDRTTLVRIVRDDPSLCASYESIFGAMPATLGRSGTLVLGFILGTTGAAVIPAVLSCPQRLQRSRKPEAATRPL